MDEQEINDLKTLINAIYLAQSRGGYKLEQAEALAKNVRNIQAYLSKFE